MTAFQSEAHDITAIQMRRFWILVCVIVPAISLARQQSTLKVDVDLVNVLFTVTDGKGRLVPGLTKDDS